MINRDRSRLNCLSGSTVTCNAGGHRGRTNRTSPRTESIVEAAPAVKDHILLWRANLYIAGLLYLCASSASITWERYRIPSEAGFLIISMFGSFPPEPWFGLTSTKSTQVAGVDIVMESTILVRCRNSTAFIDLPTLPP
jgi:hypothetical protein